MQCICKYNELFKTNNNYLIISVLNNSKKCEHDVLSIYCENTYEYDYYIFNTLINMGFEPTVQMFTILFNNLSDNKKIIDKNISNLLEHTYNKIHDDPSELCNRIFSKYPKSPSIKLNKILDAYLFIFPWTVSLLYHLKIQTIFYLIKNNCITNNFITNVNIFIIDLRRVYFEFMVNKIKIINLFDKIKLILLYDHAQIQFFCNYNTPCLTNIAELNKMNKVLLNECYTKSKDF